VLALPALSLLIGSVLLLATAYVTTGTRTRRCFGALLAVSCMIPCWLVPASEAPLRAVFAIIAFSALMRSWDLLRGQWSLRERFIHVVSVVDTRRLSKALRSDRRVAVSILLRTAVWGAVATATYCLWEREGLSSTVGFWITRWSFGLVFVYTLSEGAYGLLEGVYRALGFVTPALHIHPAASRSVQEFWGERWNRTVNLWFAETFFRPLARRRMPLLGVTAAFGASALVHAYVAWVSAGVVMAVVMFAYFMLEAGVMGLERVFRVREWPPLAGHTWTLAWMILLSPGFTEPMAVCLGFARP
jgi:hypothetical protein